MDVIYQGNIAGIYSDTLVLTGQDGTGNGLLQAKSVYNVWQATGYSTEIEGLITDTNLSYSNSGKTLTNTGAGGLVTVTLPSGNIAGISFIFVRTATQSFRIDPQASDNIVYSSGAMSTGEYIQLDSDGTILHLVSDGITSWIAINEFGSLSEETP